MSNQIDSRLVDYLDNHLSEQEAREVETLIETDDNTRQQWQYLLEAKRAMQHAALYEQVARVKDEYKAAQTETFHPAVPSRTRKMMMRVMGMAAMALVVFGIVKFVSTSNNDLYRQGYRTYALNTTRSGAAINDMELAYRGKNWQQVITTFNLSNNKDNKSFFLVAMAHMELNQFDQAANALQQVLSQNARTGDNYFQDEAEYYIALNLLALNKTKDAVKLIKKIKADPKHLYYEQAHQLSALDLSIVSFKAGK